MDTIPSKEMASIHGFPSFKEVWLREGTLWWADHFAMAKENLDFGPLLADQGSVIVIKRKCQL